jgi:hypothetical protein
MSTISPLWTPRQLEDLVHVLARDSSKVVLTDHFLQRLAERGVTVGEALRCLQRGAIIRGPTYSAEHKSFEFRMCEPPPRDIVCVVAAVKPVLDPGEVFAVTVWEVN